MNRLRWSLPAAVLLALTLPPGAGALSVGPAADFDPRLGEPVNSYLPPACAAEPFITVRVGPRTYRVPRAYQPDISAGNRSYSWMTWCQPEGAPPRIGSLSFQMRFKGPEAPAELKNALPQLIEIFSSHFTEPYMAENHLRVAEWIRRGFLEPEPKSTLSGNLVYGGYIAQKPGGATTPSGLPLTMYCPGNTRSINPHGVYFGRLCSTLYRYYDGVILTYRFHDGFFPEEDWGELDENVRRFLEGMVVAGD